MSTTYLNANIRRTAIEENRFFVETPYLDGLDLSCCRKDIVTACKSNASGRTYEPIGKGKADEEMDFHALRFTWFPRSEEWVFSGPFYAIALKPTCSREDASTWLDALFAAEESSGFLHRGPRFVHTLGIEDATDGCLVCSNHANWVIWRYLDKRLFAVRLTEVTAGTVEAIDLWKMIMYWTVTVPYMGLR